MAEPNLGLFEGINAALPYVGMIVVGVVAAIIFVWYTKKYTPEIARQLIKAYHSVGLPLFLEDATGNVNCLVCDKKFPHGVVHVRRRGWYLVPVPPNPEDEAKAETVIDKQQGPGRPPKPKVKGPEELSKLSETELEEYVAIYGMLVRTPMLKGLGKQVFFGTMDTIGVGSLSAIAHADLPKVQWLAPKMFNKAQIDSLATGCMDEGKAMVDRDTRQFLFYCVGGAIVLCAVGLIVYLLTQRPA
jgi:hypothetical protein